MECGVRSRPGTGGAGNLSRPLWDHSYHLPARKYTFQPSHWTILSFSSVWPHLSYAFSPSLTQLPHHYGNEEGKKRCTIQIYIYIHTYAGKWWEHLSISCACSCTCMWHVAEKRFLVGLGAAAKSALSNLEPISTWKWTHTRAHARSNLNALPWWDRWVKRTLKKKEYKEYKDMER